MTCTRKSLFLLSAKGVANRDAVFALTFCKCEQLDLLRKTMRMTNNIRRKSAKMGQGEKLGGKLMQKNDLYITNNQTLVGPGWKKWIFFSKTSLYAYV